MGTRGTPADREWILRAKELLIRRNGCTEQAAYARLRQMSMDGCMSLVEVAKVVAAVEG